MRHDETDIVVTGVGPVTAIGTGIDDLWEALWSGRTNATTHTLAVDIGRTVDLPLAGIADRPQRSAMKKFVDLLAAQELFGYRDLACAGLAVELALQDAGLPARADSTRVGMIQAFEAPGVESTVSTLFGAFAQPPPADNPPAVYDLLAPRFYNMQPFMYVHVLAKMFGIHGFCTNVHNACTTGAFAIETAAQRIRTGDEDVMIVVGAEAFDTAVRLEWFRRLDLYAKETCMWPFHPEANGFFVGEGAAAIVLESARHARARDAEPYARYTGSTFAHQAWKQTIPDVRSARLADVISMALKKSKMKSDDIDLIVPHGAATALSDGYERVCMKKALSDSGTHASAAAFKPNVGHMLATSGLIEVICGLASMKHSVVPPTVGCDPNRADLPAELAQDPTERPLRAMLKISTGFTGHDAASIYTAPE